MVAVNRRKFLQASGGVAALGLIPGLVPALALAGAEAYAPQDEIASEVGSGVGAEIAPWIPGVLDIHHINTGCGNSTLVVMPDGTSLLIDAGASGTTGPAMNAPRPDGSRRPGEWIARYVRRQLTVNAQPGLDYALLTHFHGDHVGDVTPQSPESTHGTYKVTGISDVAEVIPITTIIDRGFPSYSFPAPVTDPPALNYIQFIKARVKRGLPVERVRVGSSSQIAQLRGRERYPEFGVRMIAGNGEVWTGQDESSVAHFPVKSSGGPNPVSNENNCSIALRLNYGRFSYFAGGDLNCDTNYGQDPWRDIETPAAKAAGAVSVATCDHHGYFDANGPEFVRALKPRIWILQSWHASHPAMSVLANLYSPILYSGARDVFCLSLNPATALTTARFSDRFKSSQGHVLVRVAPGGAEYSVLVLEGGDESGRVKAVFGPYTS
jgi:beta-lactamase superfamily II metal-dependent hydrolase